MSYDLTVRLSRQNMPTPSAWRAAIIEAGFPVQLDSDFDVETFAGFLPAPAHGEQSGFEYYARHISVEEAQRAKLDAGIDFAITFSISSRPLELVSALAAASVLAAISGGTLKNPQEGNSYSASEAVEWTRAQIG